MRFGSKRFGRFEKLTFHCISINVFRFPSLVFNSFGLDHDGDGNPCLKGRYVMAAVLPSGVDALKWSSCSQEKLQEFLRWSLN